MGQNQLVGQWTNSYGSLLSITSQNQGKLQGIYSSSTESTGKYTIEIRFYKNLQQAVGVPVIDTFIAAFKTAENAIVLKKNAGWSSSCKWEMHPLWKKSWPNSKSSKTTINSET